MREGEDDTAVPKFRTEGKPPGPVSVFLQCSKCEKDIRPMMPSEKIAVHRGHYCPDCDDGAIHLNMPIKDDDEDN